MAFSRGWWIRRPKSLGVRRVRESEQSLEPRVASSPAPLGPEDRPRRRAIATDDAQRQADEIAWARGYTSEVEPFDDPDARPEKDSVCLGAIVERSDRWAIDPDCAEAAGGEQPCGLRRNRDIVLEELAGPTARRVPRLNSNRSPVRIRCDRNSSGSMMLDYESGRPVQGPQWRREEACRQCGHAVENAAARRYECRRERSSKGLRTCRCLRVPRRRRVRVETADPLATARARLAMERIHRSSVASTCLPSPFRAQFTGKSSEQQRLLPTM